MLGLRKDILRERPWLRAGSSYNHTSHIGSSCPSILIANILHAFSGPKMLFRRWPSTCGKYGRVKSLSVYGMLRVCATICVVLRLFLEASGEFLAKPFLCISGVGQPKFRSMWERYCNGNDAIVYACLATPLPFLSCTNEPLSNKKYGMMGLAVLI